jgi:DNA-binding MarR family transcriptional regulator
MGELSNALSVPLSTATRIVDSLVGRGYLERFSDSEDRRIVRVRLTHKGNQVYKFIDGRIAEHVSGLASSLSRPELATLMKLLGKVAAAVEQTLK